MERLRIRSGENELISESRSVNTCCMGEARFRGKSVRIINGNSASYDLFWTGNKEGLGDVGIFLTNK